jgi:hypothetical protein
MRLMRLMRNKPQRFHTYPQQTSIGTNQRRDILNLERQFVTGIGTHNAGGHVHAVTSLISSGHSVFGNWPGVLRRGQRIC